VSGVPFVALIYRGAFSGDVLSDSASSRSLDQGPARSLSEQELVAGVTVADRVRPTMYFT